MNRLRMASTTLIIATLLNTGCMQDKASKLRPSSEKKVTEKVTEEPSDINKTSMKTSIKTSMIEINELEELILAAKDNRGTSIDIGANENLNVSSDSSIDKNWVEISKEEELILTAQEFMGAKYVWAANGPECFDCSGFTRYVYKEHGMTIPRYSGHQAKVGMKVAYDELQVGDLVFFDTEKKYRKKVNHVGIYVGNDKFIHASSAKKKVVITSFKSKRFYKNRFLWGQRVVNNNAYASL